jgi:ABC-type glycerol-3-phosphate transport system substrate-binding protein
MPTSTFTLRRLSVRGAVAAVALALLTACGLGAQPAPTPEPITLRYITLPALAAAEDALIARYRADNPQVTVIVEDYNQTPDMLLAQSPAPDVMLITPGFFLDAAVASGGLSDLSNLWQESGAGDELLPSLRALSEREGKQYYLPVGYNWHGFYYDKAVFEQYGLQPPTTWDEFVQVCETLWLNGVVPLSISGADPFMGSLWLDYLNLRLNGPEVHQQLIAGEIPFTDMRIRSAFELWASLVESGYFSSAAARMGAQEALAAVVQDGNLLGAKPAMVLSGPAFLGELAPERRMELGFFPFPMLDAGQPPAEVVTAIGYMVPAGAPQRDAALNFVTFLASDQGRDVLTTDIVGGGLFAPAFAVADPSALPEPVQEGVALATEAQTVTPQLYMSVSPAMWPALADMQRRILTEPGSAGGFDLDALLARLENAR